MPARYEDQRRLPRKRIRPAATATHAVHAILFLRQTLCVGGGGYRDLLRHTFDVEGFGLTFKCVDLSTLIKLKRAAGRPKDLETLAELQALLDDEER